METRIEPDPEPPELIVTMSLPHEIKRLVRLLSNAYMSSLTCIPISMEDRLPNIASDTFPITCMVWNIQGAGSREFTRALK